MEKAKCKRCNEVFEPEMHRIFHCKKCFRELLIKFIEAPFEKVIESGVKTINKIK